MNCQICARSVLLERPLCPIVTALLSSTRPGRGQGRNRHFTKLQQVRSDYIHRLLLECFRSETVRVMYCLTANIACCQSLACCTAASVDLPTGAVPCA
jgi:hypothetical protein